MHRTSYLLSFGRLPEAALLALAAVLLCTAVGVGYAAGNPAAPDAIPGARTFHFSASADSTAAAPLSFYCAAGHGHRPNIAFALPPLAAIHIQLPLLAVALAPIPSAVATFDPPPPKLHF